MHGSRVALVRSEDWRRRSATGCALLGRRTGHSSWWVQALSATKRSLRRVDSGEPQISGNGGKRCSRAQLLRSSLVHQNADRSRVEPAEACNGFGTTGAPNLGGYVANSRQRGLG